MSLLGHPLKQQPRPIQIGPYFPQGEPRQTRPIGPNAITQPTGGVIKRKEYTAKPIKVLTLILDGTMAEHDVPISGTYLSCVWSTNLSDEVWIRFNDRSDNDQIPFHRGFV